MSVGGLRHLVGAIQVLVLLYPALREVVVSEAAVVAMVLLMSLMALVTLVVALVAHGLVLHVLGQDGGRQL